jgi:hypothetical protein
LNVFISNFIYYSDASSFNASDPKNLNKLIISQFRKYHAELDKHRGCINCCPSTDGECMREQLERDMRVLFKIGSVYSSQNIKKLMKKYKDKGFDETLKIFGICKQFKNDAHSFCIDFHNRKLRRFRA